MVSLQDEHQNSSSPLQPNLESNKTKGLYSRQQDRDACGVGFIVDMKKSASRKTVTDSLTILKRLTHRGASGSEQNTGDGAGIMVDIPHDFFAKQFEKSTIELGKQGFYGVGTLFLPKDEHLRNEVKDIIEKLVSKDFVSEPSVQLVAWRDVPTNNCGLGQTALDSEPKIEQIFIKQVLNNQTKTNKDSKNLSQKFDSILFALRKLISHRLFNFASRHQLKHIPYLCSLSSRIIVYKGQLTPQQLPEYFLDLQSPLFTARMAMVHSRYATNTFPSWERAQPLRTLCHNGEINTVRGNINQMRARQGVIHTNCFDHASLLSKNSQQTSILPNLYPIIEQDVSDSGAFDNCLEFLNNTGRELSESIMLMVPEAWENACGNDSSMPCVKRDFYRYNSCLMEPQDGPALLAFSDGNVIGAILDRNGLRPGRYYLTQDQRLIFSSEVGVVDFCKSNSNEAIIRKGRLSPGKMLLVDLNNGTVVGDEQLKLELASKFDFGDQQSRNVIDISSEINESELELESKLHFDELYSDENFSQIFNGQFESQKHLFENLRLYGYSNEHVEMLIGPMLFDGYEALGSMGTDTALACFSESPRPLSHYFKQLFAQVTNPPIDSIRESIIMSLQCMIGSQGNVLAMPPEPEACQRIILKHPILSPLEFRRLMNLSEYGLDGDKSFLKSWKTYTIDLNADISSSNDGNKFNFKLDLPQLLSRFCAQAGEAVKEGYRIILLSHLNTNRNQIPISSLMAIGAIHHYLVRNALRSKVALVAACGDISTIHEQCLSLGFGVDAIYPYVVYNLICHTDQVMSKAKLHKPCEEIKHHFFAKYLRGMCKEGETEVVNFAKMLLNYREASTKGILKVMSKMGISTLQSYKGAQIFEALGINQSVVDMCFSGCATRIGGVGFDTFARDALQRHEAAFGHLKPDTTSLNTSNSVNKERFDHFIDDSLLHQRNSPSIPHLNDPQAIALLQRASSENNLNTYRKYSQLANRLADRCTIRGRLQLKLDECKAENRGIPLQEVEPASEIVKRFVTGAMSYGSLSKEAHETLAIAMNRIGAKSNTGEGGEDPERYLQVENTQNSRRSAIKQVASGRFGVTIEYLSNADEIQIKMAQGAKPGEGGELPSHKVLEPIAKVRSSTPYVGLISPPPHHDIYSIEDLAQLIYDLRNSNPSARISVKLVSEVGVGAVACGVAKGMANHILISGHDGGTGASRLTGIKHAGLPQELGLAETHQALSANGLRERVVIQTDGQLRTGLDIVKAALLGAEEFGFSTAPLISLGCIMMRKCHLNTCPVGIATQDPELREKFKGKPENVINFLFLVAEEAREYMAKLGFRKFNEMIGRSNFLKPKFFDKNSAKYVSDTEFDFSRLLEPAKPDSSIYCTQQSKSIPNNSICCASNQLSSIDQKIIDLISTSDTSLQGTDKNLKLNLKITNQDRTTGAVLSNYVTIKNGVSKLTEDRISIQFNGSAGQSFGAFLACGITFKLFGDANDYVGKGLSGGKLIVRPPTNSLFKSDQNIIVGNVCLYGATSGYAFFSGVAAERFCVRNSGAKAVVEGVGDHGCEYMTGGVVVILGFTGRNFGAGMSGGIAYVYENKSVQQSQTYAKKYGEMNFQSLSKSTFKNLVNRDMVDLDPLDKDDFDQLKQLISQHFYYTDSSVARRILEAWSEESKHFIKVFPKDYKHALKQKALKEEELGEQEISKEHIKMNGFVSEEAGEVVNSNAHQLQDIENAFNLKNTNTLNGTSEGLKNENQVEEVGEKFQINKLKKLGGFKLYKRKNVEYRDPEERIGDWKEISFPFRKQDEASLVKQSARCMDCGVPFCHDETNGCPLSNKIPEWNNLIFNDQQHEAYKRLDHTNNFPEFTGRVCPAPCEGACVLGIIDDPVSIKSIECAIIDRAFENGQVKPRIPKVRSGKRVAIIGSGPSGLAAADILNRLGHSVNLYERNDRIGGLLMYGIPNMKLEKFRVERRVNLMKAEGVQMHTNSFISDGSNSSIDIKKLEEKNDAICLALGSTRPRDLEVAGRKQLAGIHFAMDFLTQNTKSVLDSGDFSKTQITATDRRVVVIGGGDTGNDCIGTAMRHGCSSLVNFELLSQPPNERAQDNPQPTQPIIMRVDYGHKEVASKFGKDPRIYCLLTEEFVGDSNGHVTGIRTVRIKQEKNTETERWSFKKIEGSQKLQKCDLVLLALGFLGPEHSISDRLSLDYDQRSNIRADYGSFVTSKEGIFAAGDCRRGQSLVVNAIAEGRQAAYQIDKYLSKLDN